MKARLWLIGHGAQGRRIRFFRRPRWTGQGALRIGDRVCFAEGPVPVDLTVQQGARLEIGDDAFINYGCIINASQFIRIGSRTLFGYYVIVLDNNMHELHPDRRRLRPPSAPVYVEDDVWIASRVTICPGVRIGRGSVVGAGSVVTRDVPPMTIVAGVPARKIGDLPKLPR